MQMNVAGLRRNIKNLAHNYSDAQVKVREATSNDPWGPSSTIMAEIADLTYNVVAFSEIMQMIWKRTNDHGKNWRHVYKALLLLEYLIKTGSEKVAQQCKENIFSITTLKDFQYLEEGKDQGVHVREKAKQMVMLLKDDERLKNERARALKAKERFARTASGFGSDGSIDGPSSRDRDTPVWPESDRPAAQAAGGAAAAGTEIEFVRPQTVGEEELQLQLAMAMSREEAEQEEQKRRSDDVRLQLALSQSENDFKDKKVEPKESHLVDLLDISFGAASVSAQGQNSDPWGSAANNQRSMQNDMWSNKSPAVDPWLQGYSAQGDSSIRETNNGMTNDWPRSKSPSMMSDFSRAPVANSTSIEGWLQNVQPPSGGAPALPMKTNEPWMNRAPSGDPWNNKPQVPDPWDPSTSIIKMEKNELLDPWEPSAGQIPTAAPRQTNSALAQMSPNSDLDDFDIITNRSKSAQLQAALSPNNDLNRQNNNNNVNLLDDLDPLGPQLVSHKKQQMKTPHSFLGENSALVNLDNLIKPVNNITNNNAYNPFSDSQSAQQPKNLFQQNQPPIPSINQLKQQQAFQPSTINQADPWAPNNEQSQNNLNNNNNPGWMLNNQQQQSNPFLS